MKRIRMDDNKYKYITTTDHKNMQHEIIFFLWLMIELLKKKPMKKNIMHYNYVICIKNK